MTGFLITVRHGQAVPNVPALYEKEKGKPDRSFAITPLGVSQAKAFGEWIQTEFRLHHNQPHCVVSGFLRAQQSCNEMDISNNYCVMEEFNEHGWGKFMSLEGVSTDIRDDFDSRYDHEIALKAPEGESTLDVYHRVHSGLSLLRECASDKSIIIVMHGRSLLVLRMIMEGVPPTDLGWQFVRRNAQELSNCGATYYPEWVPTENLQREVAIINSPYTGCTLQISLGQAFLVSQTPEG